VTSENGVRVYLTPLEDRPLESELMRFRLIYEGELKPSGLDPLTGNSDKLAEHKHSIRQQLHPQLRQLWRTDQFLSTHLVYPNSYDRQPSPAEEDFDGGEWGGEKIPLVEAAEHPLYGYRFVTLVKKSWSLRCALRIVLMRRDPIGGLVHAGDLDNRVKTLLDGLRRPDAPQEIPTDNKAPASAEDPFFCLLDDDKLITELSVETDTLLDEPIGDKANARWVRAIITVELQPYNVTRFNLAFA